MKPAESALIGCVRGSPDALFRDGFLAGATKLRSVIFAAMATFAGMPVFAEPVLSIPLPLTEESNVIPAEYSCPESGKVSVNYINAGENSLAIITVNDIDRVFVNVISASGARYVSGEYEWWSKGDTATFTNLTKEGSVQECVS